MRSLSAALLAACCLVAGSGLAQAEKRIFIVANSLADYGLQACPADGTLCPAAAAYCQTKQFAKTSGHRRIERDEITGAVPVSASCGPNGCDDFVAIECSR